MITNDTCYILALFKRDDGERLLLGSGYYPFADSQKHFAANAFANDVLELQGTDGQLLTGQVRRSQSQPFDGFIGDGTTIKTIVEQKRREFFLFFRKQHHYTVVYIMPDGTAIKRERGYITEAPAVQELYQVQPKYHIALAFEDVNYYSYAEDASGNEIYSFNATLGLANIEDGGLIWDENGAVSDAYVHTGKNKLDIERGFIYGYIDNAGNVNTTAGEIIVLFNQKIPVTAGKTYRFSSNHVNSNMGVSYWRSDDTYMSRNVINSTSVIQFTAPNNCAYVMLQCRYGNSDIMTKSMIEGMDLMLAEGSGPSTFEPYSQGLSTGGYIFAASTGGGPINVTVNGVDSANPVWHVVGPATNPTLTNSTTGEALVWNGTVPANQELIIDMGAQTATMEGANVFEFVSGSWIQLAPGINRISYTAANTTKGSTIYWNEVVG